MQRSSLRLALSTLLLLLSLSVLGASAVPTVTVSVPPTTLIGDTVPLTVRFDNTSATQTGYAPYVDLFLPATGVDGNSGVADDGLSFTSATYLGAPLVTTTLTLTAGGVNHPYAKTAAGTPVVLLLTDFPGAKVGDQVVVIQLPYGSFTPTQPAADIDVVSKLSNKADLGVALNVHARGGFQFGNDALDNPISDPSLVGSLDSKTVTPQLISLTKTYNGPEGETATGPNYPRSYTIRVKVAAGQTVTNVRVTDVLPNTIQFTSYGAASPAGSATSTPSTTTPGGTVGYTFASVVGGTDASLVVNFFVPRLDGQGTPQPILVANTGASRSIGNDVSALYNWPTPIDVRDAGATDALLDPPGFEATFSAKSIAIQKSFAIVTDTGAAGPTPGDVVEYTLDIQVSDYFALNNINVTDRFSDGQRLDTTFTPTLTVSEHSNVANATILNAVQFAAGNVVETNIGDGVVNNDDDPLEGGRQIVFRVSNEMSGRGKNTNLVGGGIADQDTGGALTNNPALPHGATTVQIKFRVVIQDMFAEDYPSGEAAVNARDVLTNNVTVQGDLLSATTLAALGTSMSDTSATSFTIQAATVSKTIYAINGSTTLPSPIQIAPGDTLTYRLQYTLPSGDVENLKFRDFLPLPIFKAGDPDADGAAGPAWTFDNVTSSTPPAAGHAQFGPNDTLHLVTPAPQLNVPPLTSTDTANGNNTLIFDYGTYSNTANTTKKIDIMFTMTATGDPFADGLMLTNQVQSAEGSTQQPAIESNANDIIQVQVDEPEFLGLYKGVVGRKSSTTSVGLTLGGLTFNAPGASPGFSAGTLTTTAQATAIGGNDLTAGVVDGSDQVRFAIVLQNTGRADAYDVKVSDQIPAGYVLPATAAGLNVLVTRGDGTAVAAADYIVTYNNVSGAFTVELVDNYVAGPGNGVGALNRGKDVNGLPMSDGKNAVVVTYDLTLASTATARSTIQNTAALTNYSSKEGSTNLSTGQRDTALVTLAGGTLAKALTSTEINTTGNSNTQAVIGELVTYTLSLTVPEGKTANAKIVDTLDAGLAFVDVTTVTIPANVTGNFPTVSATPTNTSVTGSGQTVTFNLGDIVNSNNSDGTPEVIQIVYRAVVLNVAGNQGGTLLNNSAVFSHDYTNIAAAQTFMQAAVSANNVTVVEPALTITKTVGKTSTGPFNAALAAPAPDAFDTIYYQIQITNASGAPSAFDISLSDAVPAAFNNLAMTSVTMTSAAGVVGGGSAVVGGTARAPLTTDFAFTGNTLNNSQNIDILPDTRITIVFSGTLVTGVTPSQLVSNTATVTWTSLDALAATQRSSYNVNSTERDGSGGVNDYTATSVAATLTVNAPTLTKSLVRTSESFTTFTGGAERVAVGEIVRYRLQTEVPEGTSPNTVILDRLPAGMAFANDSTAMIAFVSSTSGKVTSSKAGVSGGALDQTGDETSVSTIVPTFVLPDVAVSSADSTNAEAFGNGTDVRFQLGNVVNSESDSNKEFIVIEFNAVVLNSFNTGNQAATTLNNDYQYFINITADSGANSTATAGNQRGSTSNAVGVSVVEPNLTIANVASTAGPVDALDTYTYTITVSNNAVTQFGANNDAPAFDVAITDALETITATNPTAEADIANPTIGGDIVITTPAYCTILSSTLSSSGFTITFNRLNAGDNIQITVTARVVAAAKAGGEIENAASATYTSLPGAAGTVDATTASNYGTTLIDLNPGTDATLASAIAGSTGGIATLFTERTGANGGPPTNSALQNNYAVSAAAASGLIVRTPTIDKGYKDGAATAANGDSTLTTSSGANVVIGEQFTYDILVTLPEGVTTNLKINDTVPAGLRVESYSVLTTSGSSTLLTQNFNGTLAAPTVTPALPAAGAATVVYNFGTVTVNADAVANNTSFVIRVTATVLNVIGNQDGINLLGAATLAFDDPDGSTNAFNAAQTITVNDAGVLVNPTFTVREPILTVTKTVNNAGTDAGDTVTYTIQVTNSTSYVAYDVTLRDIIDSSLTNVTLTGVTASGFAPFSAPVLSDFRFNAGQIDLEPAGPLSAHLHITAAATFSLTFDAQISQSVVTGQAIPNKAEIFWTTLNSQVGDGSDADERTGAGIPNPSSTTPDPLILNNQAICSSVTRTAVAVPVVSHSIVTTSQPNAVTTGTNVTIGEFITYRVTVSLPEGVANNLTIDENLPAGVAYVPGSLVLSSSHPDETSLDDAHPGTGTAAFNDAATLSAPTVTRIAGAGNFVSGDDVRFTFGSITTKNDNDVNNNTFSFTYQVLVLDVAGNVGLTGGPQTTLNPTGTWVVGNIVAATTADVGATYNAAGGTGGKGAFTAAPASVDGVTLSVGDLVLVKNQGTATQNGIYKVLAAGSWERWVNFDQDNEVSNGYRAEIVRGATNIGKVYTLTAAPLVLNTDPLAFNAAARNSVLVDTNSAGNPNAQGVSATVVEPKLTITKAIVVNGSGTSGDAGDPAVYTITISHFNDGAGGSPDSAANAYDLNLTDSLPAKFAPASSNPVVATISTAGDTTTKLTLTGQNLTTTGVINLSQGETLTVSISGTLTSAVRPTDSVSNTADLTYNTTPNASTTQATNLISDTPPGCADGTDRERQTSLSASASFTVPGATFSKSMVDSSQTFTSGANVAIGETVTYAMKVTLPEGTTPDLTIVDQLPAGMQYVAGSATVVTAAASSFSQLAADFNGTVPAPTVTGGATAGAAVNIVFGSISVSGDNVANNNSFVVLLTARVLNVIGNQSGTILTNKATFDISTDSAAVFTTPNVNITVVEPRITVAKTVTSAVTGLDAGDSVNYQVTLNNLAANGATTDAFDISLTDVLPSNLVISSIGAPTLNGGAAVDTALAGSGSSTLTGVFDIPLAGSVMFTYTAVIQNGVTPGQTLTSDLNVFFTSLDGADANERTGASIADPEDNTPPTGGLLNNYAVGVDVSVTAGNVFSMTKSLAATSHTGAGATAANDVVIGEVATFELAVTVFEGTTSNLSITDTLPAGLSYVAGSASVSNANGMTVNAFNASLAGQVLTLTASSVVNPGGSNSTTNDPATTESDTFYIRYQALVTNVVGNQNGTTLTNKADASATGVTADTNNTVTLTVKEPVLTLTKTLAASGSDAGDQVVYTLVISNTGTATAYDLALSDTLDTDLELVAPFDTRLVVAGTPTPPAYLTLDSTANTSSAVNAVINELRNGDSVTLTLTARIAQSSNPNNTVSNTATVTYTSLPGTDANERTGAGGVNDYAISASAANFTLATPTISKALVTTANALGTVQHVAGNTDVTVGELITYDITVTFTEGTTTSTVITDQGQGNATGALEVVSAAIQSTGANLTLGSSTIALSDSLLSDGIKDRATITLGTVTNTFDGVSDAKDQLVIRVTARVADAAANVNSRAISNTASLAYGTGPTQTTPAVNVDVVEPNLVLTKSSNDADGIVSVGQIVTYTVTVANLAANGSTAPAYDVRVQDLLPAGLTLVAGSVTSTGTIVTGNTAGDTNVVIDYAQINLGSTVTITYKTQVVATSGTIDNTAKCYWDSLPADESVNTSGTYTADGTPDRDYGAVAANEVFNATTDPAQDTERITVGSRSIGDFVWNDLNNNGAQDAGEPGLPNVKLYLDYNNDGVADPNEPSVTTNASGNYTFSSLADGTYVVLIDTSTLPAGVTPSYDADGVATASVATVTVSGANRTDVDFGYQGNGSIGDLVWSDEDGDGVQNGSELGISGVTVDLIADTNGNGAIDGGEPVLATKTTNGSGGYSFGGLVPGKYIVHVTDTAGKLDGTTLTGGTEPLAVTLAAGQNFTTADFGYRGTASLAGSVYYDANNNGVRDSGEFGIAGVSITLTGTNDLGQAVSLSTTTDGNGNYSFDHLHDGPYTITEPTEPTGFSDGTDTAGNLGGSTASSPDRISFTLTPGGSATGYNFGERLASTLSKTIVSTSDAGTSGSNVSIGEIVRYRLVADLPHATIKDLQLRDNLPAGMQFLNDGAAKVAFISTAGSGVISSTAVSGAEAAGPLASVTPSVALPDGAVSASASTNDDTYASGTAVFFKLGDVTNTETDPDSEYVVIEFNAVVVNEAGNQDGTALSNTFTLRLDTTGDNVAEDSSTSSAVTVNVVEPDLAVTKTLVTSSTGVEAGDTVTYQIVVSHTAASTGHAYDLNLADTLSAKLSGFALVSAVVSDGTTTTDVSGALSLTAGGVLSTTGKIDLLRNTGGAGVHQALTVVVNGKVINAVQPGDTIDNSATVTWSGQDGSVSGERDGSGGVNDYTKSGSAPTITVPGVLNLTKAIVGSSSAAIGDVVTYELTVQVIEGTTANLQIVDTLPAGLSYVSGSANVFNANGMTVSGFSDNLAGQVLTLSATSVLNPAANDSNGTTDNSAFKIRYQALVLDDAINCFNNAVLNNDADATANGGLSDLNNVASLTVIEPVLQITKSANNTTPHLLDTVTYTLTISHTAASTATVYDIELRDIVPAGLTLNVASISVSGATATNSSSGNNIVLALNQLALGNTITITYSATVNNAPGVFASNQTNTAQIWWDSQPADDTNAVLTGSPDGQPDRDYGPASDSETLTIVGSDLAITKSDGGATVIPNGLISYTLTYFNNGNRDASGVVISETIPANTTFVSAGSTAGWSFASGDGAGTTGTITIGSVPAGGNGSVTIVVKLNAHSALPSGLSQVSNTATIADDGTNGIDPTPADNTSTDTTPILTADLRLAKTVDVPEPNVGTNVVYTLTLNNDGPNDAHNVTVADALPAGLVLVGSTASQGSYAGGVWTIGTVANGGGATLSVTVKVVVASQITNTAQVSASDEYDPDSTPGNNAAGEDDQSSVLIKPQQADLAIVKTVDDPTPKRNQIITYTIALTNNGIGIATNVTAADVLPSGLEFVSSSVSQGTYDAGTGVWTVGTLNYRDTATLDIRCKVLIQSMITNTASVTHADQNDPNPDNNTSTVTIQPEIADLEIKLSITSPFVVQGEELDMNLMLRNDGPDPATNVQVTVTLPPGEFTFKPEVGTYDPKTNIWFIPRLEVGAVVNMKISTIMSETVTSMTASAQVTWSDQFDPDSVPANESGREDDESNVNVQVIAPQVLQTTCFAAKLNFAAANKDRLLYKGQLALPAGFSAASKTIQVNVDGWKYTTTLSAKGVSRSGSVMVQLRKKKTVWELTVRGNSSDLKAIKDAVNEDVKKFLQQGVRITATIDNTVYLTKPESVYIARKNQTGTLTRPIK